jgi:methionine synthase I (cobalamin-dependent)
LPPARTTAVAGPHSCTHPTHFAEALPPDAAEELDAGDARDLAAGYVALRGRLPALDVLGGCCGTDISHVTAICDAWLVASRS